VKKFLWFLCCCLVVLFGMACGKSEPVVTGGVDFLSPTDNAVVGPIFVVRLSAEAFKIVPATGTAVAGEAHHHVFVDIDPTPDSLPIPKSDGIFHIGSGADSLVLTLPVGKHRLIAVPATGDHVPIKGARRDTVNIEVKAGSVTPS
jgi:hypothetical protein